MNMAFIRTLIRTFRIRVGVRRGSIASGNRPLASRDTLLFNGYAEQVAHLYDGMDLQRYF